MIAEAAPGRGFDTFTSESLEVKGRTFTVRRAVESDVPAIVALLRDDVLGAAREGSADGSRTADIANSPEPGGADATRSSDQADDSAAYARAFTLISADPNQLLIVVEEDRSSDVEEDGDIVGTLQLSLIPSLSRRGTLRLQIEAVRIGAAAQGIGLGTSVFEWAHDLGRRFGAGLVQLTTDKSRADAQRFYSRLGYVASHEGLKLQLD